VAGRDRVTNSVGGRGEIVVYRHENMSRTSCRNVLLAAALYCWGGNRGSGVALAVCATGFIGLSTNRIKGEGNEEMSTLLKAVWHTT